MVSKLPHKENIMLIGAIVFAITLIVGIIILLIMLGNRNKNNQDEQRRRKEERYGNDSPVPNPSS